MRFGFIVVLTVGAFLSGSASNSQVYDASRGSIPLPSPVLDHIPEAQAMTHQISPGDDLSNIYFVFSGNRMRERAGGGAPTINPGGIVSYYYPVQRDMDRGHDLGWFNAHHPDWVTYTCDRKTPSYGYSYGWGAYMPIDTSNPEVRRYLLDTYFVPASKQGYRAIALDNVSVANSDHRCGVYRGGRWVQLYSGESYDPQYVADKLSYLHWVVGEMHARGMAVAMNAKVDPKHPDLTRQLVDLADIWIDEGEFLDGCKGRITDDVWDLRRRLVQSLGPNRAHDSINKSCSSSFAQVSKEDADYAVASFLIVRTARSYLSLFGMGESGRRVRTPYAQENIGAPAGPARNLGLIWWRPYEKGLSVVNPSSNQPGTLSLPPGRWMLDGRSVTQHLLVPPATGYILHRG